MGRFALTPDRLRNQANPVSLTWDGDADLPGLEATLDVPEAEAPLNGERKLGFLHHFRKMVESLLIIFVLLGIAGALLGLAIFYFGVVLPFGLL